MSYHRFVYKQLIEHLQCPTQFIQVLVGPRQVGKTTIAEQITEEWLGPIHFVSADEPGSKSPTWLEQNWSIVKQLSRDLPDENSVLFIIDEVQKIPNWDSLSKLYWDKAKREKWPIKLLILGSSPWLIQKGLTESLAGRFELIPITHWTFKEMQQAFKVNLDQYIFFGGYPGAASLMNDEKRWKEYIKNSLIETTVSRDILLMSRIDKPSLLRQLFELGCLYSGQILSLQKILGQLHDAGNTTTLSHYLELFCGAGLLTGLQKYSGNLIRKRASSPKFQVLNTALISAQTDLSFEDAVLDRDYWGRLVESAVGSYLINQARRNGYDVFYWREGNYEVDYVLQLRNQIVALEVKSGTKKFVKSGLDKFKQLYPKAKLFHIGGQGMLLEDFFKMDIANLFD